MLCSLSAILSKPQACLHVLPMEDVCVLGAVHEDFGPIPFLGPSAVPPMGLLALAHGRSLAARVSHAAVCKTQWVSCNYVSEGLTRHSCVREIILVMIACCLL